MVNRPTSPAPERVLSPGTAVAVLGAVAVAVSPSLSRPFALALAAFLALSAGAAAATRRVRIAAVATLCSGAVAAILVPPLATRYPLPLGVALAASVGMTLALEGREGLRWLRVGTWNRPVAAWTLAVILVSGLAVAGGARLSHHLVHRLLLPIALPPFAIGSGILGWSALNAATEEMAFRGVLLHALEVEIGIPSAILLQAVAFGVMHLPVAPGGWTGCALVSVFAVAAALLRRRSGGLLAPWLAHMAADVVVLTVRLVG
jgi:membrane protease YdiL (CAAX protease family)